MRRQPELQRHHQQRRDKGTDHQAAGRSRLSLIFPALLRTALDHLLVLAPQSRQAGFDLADALLDHPLIRPVHVLSDHVIEAGGELGEVAAQVLTQL
ncbi:hypothetical protein [Streptomyces sp. NPDC017529]|uniref:hypothetical protein n=1 Tax=Streptomyces sp. NPDC017529 TaxID=3365000 RepID=UPI0037948721